MAAEFLNHLIKPPACFRVSSGSWRIPGLFTAAISAQLSCLDSSRAVVNPGLPTVLLPERTVGEVPCNFLHGDSMYTVSEYVHGSHASLTEYS